MLDIRMCERRNRLLKDCGYELALALHRGRDICMLPCHGML